MMMAANQHRGEIEALLDGKLWKLCLTLGALAELECTLNADNLLTLVAKFENNALTSKDLIAVIGAGLRGAGNLVTDDQVANMRCDNGLVGFTAIAIRLLNTTFAIDDGQNTPLPLKQQPRESSPNPR